MDAVAPVVVTAARFPPSIGDAAFSIVGVDAPALQTSDRLDDALTSVAGASLYRRTSSLGANPTTQGVSLRGIAGSGASRALVTLDGAPQNDPFGGWVVWTGLPTEAIGAIEVVRGAGSGPYGAGALTGVVALRSRDDIPGGLIADADAGGLGFHRAALVAQAVRGDTRAYVDASGESSDGWIPVRAGRGSVDTRLTLHDWSAAERIEADLGGAVLSERIGAYQENRRAGTEFAGSVARGAQGSLTLTAQPTPQAWGWRLQGWATGSDLANTTATVAPGRATATLADDQFATPAYGFGLNAALRRSTGDVSVEIGTDLRDARGQSRERLYSQGAFSAERTSGGGALVAGAYVDASLRRGPWLVTGGGRLDGWSDYGSSLDQTGRTALHQSAPDQSGVLPTGRIGVRDEVSGAVYLRAAAYAGFRPATLNELHRAFRVGNDVTLANAALAPERLYGAEVGLGGVAGGAWSLTAFYNRLASAITNVTIGHGPGSFPDYPLAGFVAVGGTLHQRENAGSVDAYGLEGEIERRLAASLSLRLGFGLTHARVDGGSLAPQLTGLRPAETPAETVTAGAVWRPDPRLEATVELRYEGDRFDDDQNTRRIAAGTGVDARIDYALGRRVSVFVAADNLFDAALQTGRTAAGVVSYDAPASVRVGVRLR